MGLDILEMFMEVEERFDIDITEEEMQHIGTVGELYACVQAKV